MPFETVEFPVNCGYVSGGCSRAMERIFMTTYFLGKYSGKHIRSTREVSIFLPFRLHELSHKHLEKNKNKKKLHLFCNYIFLSITTLGIKFSLMLRLKKTTAGNLMGIKMDYGVS